MEAYIYKIEVGDAIYIGSTTDIAQRQRQHNSDLKRGCEFPIYKYCRENGINEVELILLERVESEDRFIVEKYYIDEYMTGHKLLNVLNACGYNKKTYDKEYSREYYKKNRDRIKQRKKTYYEANKEKIIEKERLYSEANKYARKKYMKEYYLRKKAEKSN